MRKSKWTFESYYPAHFKFTVPSLWRIWWFFGYHGLYQINWWWKARKSPPQTNKVKEK